MFPLKTSRSTTSFSLSSLKDIETLALDADADSDSSTALSDSSPSLRRIIHRVRATTTTLRALRPNTNTTNNRILIYFTSLRIVRKTFDDCRSVRNILRSFRVALDERDLSLDSRFSLELKRLLPASSSLPQVFIAGKYIGGADEIRRLHESGELKQLVEGLAPFAGACGSCGGVRFVLCGRCSGSHKWYSEKTGFRSCGDCNENGLVRCPDCNSLAV